jgi:hypothetical protein
MPLIKLNNRSIKDVTSFPFGVGTLVHISSQTASNSASISFTTGINSTYKEYQFYFIDIHARTNGANFTFNLSTDSGSNYNVTKTTTYFMAIHTEADDFTVLEYRTDYDIAQGTGFQNLARSLEGTDADGSLGGSLQLFNPVSTTYVKHFIARVNSQETSGAGASEDNHIAGYGNTTSAINAVQFKMSSGNMDGTIAMFGVV